MSKLSEIIGGIAKDLVQVQVSSDISSLDILTHYKSNPLFQTIDIPRFTVSEINLKLKFAIDKEIVKEPKETMEDYVEAEWLNIIKSETLNDILTNIKDLSKNEQKIIREKFSEATTLKSKQGLDVKNAIDDKANTTVSKSVDFIVDAMKKMPGDIKTKLPPAASLKKIINDQVEATYNSKLSLLKRVATAKKTNETEIEIIIEKEALDNISVERIHEIDINLKPDFIKISQD